VIDEELSMRRVIVLAVLLFLSTQASAVDQVAVTNVDDSGPGSLRQAILDLATCGRPCHIVFFIAGTPQNGFWTIAPLTPLPGIFGNDVHIDGHTQTTYGGDTNPNGPEIVLSGAHIGTMGAGLRFERIGSAPYPHGDYTIRGLGFEHFQVAALSFFGAIGIGLRPFRISEVTIADNYFGVDAHGQIPAANGVAIRMGLVDDVVIANNVISGNELGISISAGSRVRISRNKIGTDAGGAIVLGNATTGIRFNGVDDSLVERNVIAGHAAAVTIEGLSSRGNTVHRNQLFENAIGIDLRNDGPTLNDSSDLDSGPNDLQNHPTLRVNGRTLRGELDSTPLSDFDIDIYATDAFISNEGRRYIGTVTVTTDSKGRAQFSFSIPTGSGPYFTATATNDRTRSTSEFGQPVN
jgi:parallel beta-helix repeat protein